MSAAREISGDARVATSAGGHFATSHNAVNAIEKQRTGTDYGSNGDGGARPGGGGKKANQPTKPPPAAFQKPNEPLLKTKKGAGEVLCTWYNKGECKGSDGGKCPKDASMRHLCHWCLGTHTALTCRKVGNGPAPDKTNAYKKKKGSR